MASHSEQESQLVDSMLQIVFRQTKMDEDYYNMGEAKLGYTFEKRISGRPEFNYRDFMISLEFELRTNNLDDGRDMQIPGREGFKRSVDVMREMFSARQVPFGSDENVVDEFRKPRTNCSIFLQYNLYHMTDETRESIRFLVENNLIDCLILTPEAVEQDLINCFGETFSKLDFNFYQLQRIAFLANEEVLCKYEEWVKQTLLTTFDNQDIRPPQSRVIERLGLEVDNEDSICYWAARNKIPIFCTKPYGGDLFEGIFARNNRRISFDIEADSVRMKKLFDNLGHAKRGIIVLGESGQYRLKEPLIPVSPSDSKDPVWSCIDYAVVVLSNGTMQFDFLDKMLSLDKDQTNSFYLEEDHMRPWSNISFAKLSGLFPIMVNQACSQIATPHFRFGTPLTTIVCLAEISSTGLSKAIQIVNRVLENRRLTNGRTDDELIGHRRSCDIVLECRGLLIEGHRESIRFLVRHKLVDHLVLSGEFVFEDLARCFSKRSMMMVCLLLQPSFFDLGDTNPYIMSMRWLMCMKSKIIEEQRSDASGTRAWPASRIIERLGLEIENESSICYWAAKNKIPIYSEGFAHDFDTLKRFESSGCFEEESVTDKLNLITRGNSEMMVITASGESGAVSSRLAETLGAQYRVIFTKDNELPVRWDFHHASNGARIPGDKRITFPLLVAQTFFRYAESSE